MILLISALSDGKARQEEAVKSTAQPGGMNSYVCNAPEGAEHCNVSPAGQAGNTEPRKFLAGRGRLLNFNVLLTKNEMGKKGFRYQGNNVFLPLTQL